MIFRKVFRNLLSMEFHRFAFYYIHIFLPKTQSIGATILDYID